MLEVVKQVSEPLNWNILIPSLIVGIPAIIAAVSGLRNGKKLKTSNGKTTGQYVESMSKTLSRHDLKITQSESNQKLILEALGERVVADDMMHGEIQAVRDTLADKTDLLEDTHQKLLDHIQTDEESLALLLHNQDEVHDVLQLLVAQDKNAEDVKVALEAAANKVKSDLSAAAASVKSELKKK